MHPQQWNLCNNTVLPHDDLLYQQMRDVLTGLACEGAMGAHAMYTLSFQTCLQATGLPETRESKPSWISICEWSVKIRSVKNNFFNNGRCRILKLGWRNNYVLCLWWLKFQIWLAGAQSNCFCKKAFSITPKRIVCILKAQQTCSMHFLPCQIFGRPIRL